MNNLNVFISYSWESDDIKKFVRWFATFLEKYDINSKLDVFEVFPGSDLQEYMKAGLNNSNYVICICTESYKEKMTNSNTGVGTEIRLLESMDNKPFIIPLIQKGEFGALPDFFKSKFISEVDMFNPQSSENKGPLFELISLFLKRESIGVEKPIETPLSRYAADASLLKIQATISNHQQFNYETDGVVKFHHAYNGHSFDIGRGGMSFETRWSTCGEGSIYSYNKEISFERIPKINSIAEINNISQLLHIERFSIRWGGQFHIGDGLLWINENDIAAIGLIKDIHKSDDPLKSYVEFEYKILNPIENESPFE